MAWFRRISFRTVLIVVALAVASGSFSVLTGHTEATKLAVKSTAESNARGVYDILVRPATTPTDSGSGGDVGDKLLDAREANTIHGGISLSDWEQIRKVPGVDVAAPVAIVGTTVMQDDTLLRHPALDVARDGSIARVKVTYTYDNGTSVQHAAPNYLINTSDGTGIDECEAGEGDGDKRYLPSISLNNSTTYCRTRARPDPWDGQDANIVRMPVPLTMAAVDPESEARLSGLDEAMTDGVSLRAATPQADGQRRQPLGAGEAPEDVPMILSTLPGVQYTATYTVEKLDASALGAMRAAGSVRGADGLPGETVLTGEIDSTKAYENYAQSMATPDEPWDRSHNGVDDADINRVYHVQSPGLSDASGASGGVAARDFGEQRTAFVGPYTMGWQFSQVFAGMEDSAFRPVRGAAFAWMQRDRQKSRPPAPVLYGRFDPGTLNVGDAFAAPLDTWQSTQTGGRDDVARAALGGSPLAPSPNLGGFVLPAPQALMPLSALQRFAETDYSTIMPHRRQVTDNHRYMIDRGAPLSFIRVRVADVTGADAVSQERVRVVAEQIHVATGLRTDIVLGASGATVDVDLAQGLFGRPALALEQMWSKKGVVAEVLAAVDKKSLLLFILVLVVCGVFVVNLMNAAVRARRSELAVRACVGWSRWRIFRLVLWQSLAMSAVAGVLGAVAAYVVGRVVDAEMSWWRAAWAFPVAVSVAFPAAVAAAWASSRVPPMEAVSTPVKQTRHGSPSSLVGLAWLNTRRDRSRTTLAVIGLAVAVSAATTVATIVFAFRGTVVGTLLGDAVAVQVRGVDVATVAGIVALAAVGVANVLFLNIRERGRELALLRSLGWTESRIALLILTEGLFLGFVASAVGAVVGGAVVVGLTRAFSVMMGASVGASFVVGVVVAVVAASIPVQAIRHIPTAQLLTEESA